MQAQDNLDHHNLLDMGFIYQVSPHAGNSMVYSLKKGVCRGDVFLLKIQVKHDTPPMYEVRVASYWDGEMESEFLRDVTTVQDVKLFYEFGLNTIIKHG
jgi:hypothetical protein